MNRRASKASKAHAYDSGRTSRRKGGVGFHGFAVNAIANSLPNHILRDAERRSVGRRASCVADSKELVAFVLEE
jgi:hypothetical protein